MRGTVEVHQYLVERAVPHEFYRLDRPLRRIEEAPAVLGLNPGIVVAAELFEGAGSRVLALIPVSSCASAEEVARAVGLQKVRAVSRGRTAALTGYLPDWMPPVAHERPGLTVLDSALVGVDVVYTAGGDPGVMLMLRSADLVRATAATVASLAGKAASTPV